MSGKPSSDGVSQFRLVLSRYSVAEARTELLRPQIDKLTQELAGQEDECRKAQALMFKLMEEMGVAFTGNSGDQAPASWFFSELYRQIYESNR